MNCGKKKIWTNVLSVILGCIFLLSGFGKLDGIAAFESLIESYGFPHLAFLAPAIVLAEILLGMLLVLRFRPRLLGWITGIMLLLFTALYTYAFVVHGITDCGCFGNNPVLKSSPAMSYIRNAAMIIMSIVMIVNGDGGKKRLSVMMICGIAVMMTVCAFVAGKTYRVPSMFVKPHPLFMKPVSDTKIPEYLDISSDSTYVIYVFSYDCAGCWNNMANFMNYKADSIADRMYGLCVGGKGKKTFMNYFKPEFDIYEVDESFSENVSVVPTFFYIKDGLVHDLIQGEVLNPKLFRDNYLNDNK